METDEYNQLTKHSTSWEMQHVKSGGVVLCGGQSKRMGLPKATLPFGPELMLQRVVRLLGEVVDPLVVVAASTQELPELPAGTIVARDEHERRGPLEGLLAGLTAIREHADAAYVTSCDVPLLKGAFVRKMIGLLGDHQICVPVEREFHHPFAAVYRTTVIPNVQSLLAAGRMRPVFLFEEVATRRVPLADLMLVDARLSTLANLNTPDEYLLALKEVGLEAIGETIRQLNAGSILP